ncbi:MAG: hypothetical protein WAO74_04660 [Polaribacter sp.]|uniref:hypothetical protein n=1 Tax=Polaribacter sp. TaxID=1920175 RepID=UPI003BAE64F5
MKKIILSCILCTLLLQINGQNNAYYNRMQHVFGNIDMTKVTTGYLKEFGIRFNTIEVDISNYNSINDEYEILWAKSNTNNSYAKTDYDVIDCKTGAATVAAAGRVIAFGSFFGCVPCAFVGGAITALGSIGFIACVATNS